MYSNRRKTLQTVLPLFDFKVPFGGALDAENRWVKLATQVPWDEVEAVSNDLINYIVRRHNAQSY